MVSVALEAQVGASGCWPAETPWTLGGSAQGHTRGLLLQPCSRPQPVALPSSTLPPSRMI